MSLVQRSGTGSCVPHGRLAAHAMRLNCDAFGPDSWNYVDAGVGCEMFASESSNLSYRATLRLRSNQTGVVLIPELGRVSKHLRGTRGPGGLGYSTNLGQNATHVLCVEGSQGFGPNRSLHANAETDGGRRLLVGSLHDAYKVVASLRPQERVHATAHLLNHLLDVLGALGGLGNALRALLRPVDEGHVLGHSVVLLPIGPSPGSGRHTRYRTASSSLVHTSRQRQGVLHKVSDGKCHMSSTGV